MSRALVYIMSVLPVGYPLRFIEESSFETPLVKWEYIEKDTNAVLSVIRITAYKTHGAYSLHYHQTGYPANGDWQGVRQYIDTTYLVGFYFDLIEAWTDGSVGDTLFQILEAGVLRKEISCPTTVTDYLNQVVWFATSAPNTELICRLYHAIGRYICGFIANKNNLDNIREIRSAGT